MSLILEDGRERFLMVAVFGKLARPDCIVMWSQAACFAPKLFRFSLHKIVQTKRFFSASFSLRKKNRDSPAFFCVFGWGAASWLFSDPREMPIAPLFPFFFSPGGGTPLFFPIDRDDVS